MTNIATVKVLLVMSLQLEKSLIIGLFSLYSLQPFLSNQAEHSILKEGVLASGKRPVSQIQQVLSSAKEANESEKINSIKKMDLQEKNIAKA